MLAPLTGVVASGGREMVEGTQFWFEQIKNEIAGRKVELLIEDDASLPDTALQKARRLVEQANVHFLMGNLLANTGLAVANYVKGTGTPYFIPIIAADDLTQRERIKNVIRVAGYSASAFTHPFGDWALKQGYKRIVDDQPGLFVRSRAVRRLRPGLHRGRRPDRGAVLASAEHLGFQPLSRPDRGPEVGRRVRHGEWRRRHPLPSAICELRIERPDTAARRHEHDRPGGDPHARRRMRGRHLPGAFRRGLG